MTGPSSPPNGSPDWWDARYREGDIPWDTGVVPPEVVTLIAGIADRAGWALDLGCGTGLNTRYLAANGFTAIGIDLAQSALASGRRQAGALPAFFICGDVSDLSFLDLRAAIALDIGCFHALAPDRRPAYVRSLARHLLPGAPFLLYVHQPPEIPAEGGPVGADAPAVATFANHFDLFWSAHGMDGERAAAWHLMRRR